MIFVYWLNSQEFLPNGKMFIAKMSQNPLFKRRSWVECVKTVVNCHHHVRQLVLLKKERFHVYQCEK